MTLSYVFNRALLTFLGSVFCRLLYDLLFSYYFSTGRCLLLMYWLRDEAPSEHYGSLELPQQLKQACFSFWISCRYALQSMWFLLLTPRWLKIQQFDYLMPSYSLDCLQLLILSWFCWILLCGCACQTCWDSFYGLAIGLSFGTPICSWQNEYLQLGNVFTPPAAGVSLS